MPEGNKNDNEFRKENAFKNKLTEAMGTASSDDFIKVNENFEVTSRSARESLQPRISSEQPNNLLLSIEYGKERFQQGRIIGVAAICWRWQDVGNLSA